MSDSIKEWDETIREIATTYSEVDRRSLSIPGFSLAPLGIYLWAFLKWYFLFWVDLFLFIPVNLVILMRNMFPGKKWRYRLFSGRYFKAAIQWIWNGEVPLLAIVAIGSMTNALLRSHFHKRLDLIRRRIILEGGLTDDERAKLVAAIDKVLLPWPAPTPWKTAFTYGLTLLSPIASFYHLFVPGASGPWTRLLVITSLSYALIFLNSAFLIKRGLMLGGVGRSAYFPGLLAGRGAYAIEEQVLGKFGLAVKELPLGFVISLILLVVSYVQMNIMYEAMYATQAVQEPFSKATYLALAMSGFVLTVLLGAIAVSRRNRLGRR
jgi:hypothetical protein